ncbi:spore germination protein [Desnuesiella massiliensis]|uniref:spore germination protein n=1 Tax=Desnuesiella massiliensis TaxID=1650662 RepID=UPI0006E12030|nr:spore germination protein [Desnuesiella massiliensis]
MDKLKIENRIQEILKQIPSATPVVRKFLIGNKETIHGVIIYLDNIVDKNIIDRDILRPLMIDIKEDLNKNPNIAYYLIEKHIAISNATVDTDIQRACYNLKRGKTVILIDGVEEFIILDTTKIPHRNVSEPENEVAIHGPRDGFVESIEINVSLLKNKIKDRNLIIENIETGRRTQTDIAIAYIDDIVDKDILADLKNRLELIDMDGVLSTGIIEQCIEEYTYSIFPQIYGSERPDVISANILEGRIAVILDGTPYVISVPTVLPEFFQTVEDHYERTLVGTIARFIRLLGTIMVISLPSIYLILIKFNSELIPIKFLIPIIRTRRGIALTPFMEILAMIFVVELLREGGLRLPSKIAQTLSVVGGLIIGTAAIEARMVSQATILIIGVTTAGTFIVPNYQMALSIRLVSLIMLILSNIFGVIGFSVGWYLLIVHLFSLKSFGVPYFNITNYRDLRDIFIRVPIWKMNKRPESIPNKNPIRQTDFRKKFRRDSDE